MGLSEGRFTGSKTTPGRLTVVSEIGYGSLPDLVENNQRFARNGNPLTPPYRYHKGLAESFRQALKQSGLDSVYPDLQKFCLDQQEIHSQGNKRMLEAIRSNSSTGGYCVHALTGGDWVIGAGLIDLFRNPKGSYQGTKEANQPRYLALRLRPRNVYSSEGTKITITGINDLKAVSGTLAVDVVSPDGASAFHEQKDVTLESGITPVFSATLDTQDLAGVYVARATLTDATGNVVAKNSVDIDVFSNQQLTAPRARIAVLDINNSLRPFLREVGIDFTEFGVNTPKTIPVFVSKPMAGNPQAQTRFANLERFVQQGGTAVYLETVLRWSGNPLGGGKLPTPDVLPIRPTIQAAKGLWVGVAHVVTDHPVFEGLPSKCMMGQAYENVWSAQTLKGIDGELIVGSVSHGWFQGQKEKQDYLGPSPAWYGMDMGVVPLGQGRYVLSSLRVLEYLGTDPVADKILFNMINWTAEQAE